VNVPSACPAWHTGLVDVELVTDQRGRECSFFVYMLTTAAVASRIMAVTM